MDDDSGDNSDDEMVDAAFTSLGDELEAVEQQEAEVLMSPSRRLEQALQKSSTIVDRLSAILRRMNTILSIQQDITHRREAARRAAAQLDEERGMEESIIPTSQPCVINVELEKELTQVKRELEALKNVRTPRGTTHALEIAKLLEAIATKEAENNELSEQNRSLHSTNTKMRAALDKRQSKPQTTGLHDECRETIENLEYKLKTANNYIEVLHKNLELQQSKQTPNDDFGFDDEGGDENVVDTAPKVPALPIPLLLKDKIDSSGGAHSARGTFDSPRRSARSTFDSPRRSARSTFDSSICNTARSRESPRTELECEVRHLRRTNQNLIYQVQGAEYALRMLRESTKFEPDKDKIVQSLLEELSNQRRTCESLLNRQTCEIEGIGENDSGVVQFSPRRPPVTPRRKTLIAET